METEKFNAVIEAAVDRSLSMLSTKNDHYAGVESVDRLAGIKKVAAIKGTSNRDAIAGLMAKHTASIYDLCRDESPAAIEVWNEKIGDHINYLLLLEAVVREEFEELGLDILQVGEDLNKVNPEADVAVEEFMATRQAERWEAGHEQFQTPAPVPMSNFYDTEGRLK